jgi:hypothetical protein
MTPSQQIDKLISGIEDWRGKVLAQVRKAILSADPAIKEEWKWRGTPVWERDGIIAVANPHKNKVKLTFFHGAQLKDTTGLFNTGLDGNKWRAIDWLEGDHVDAAGIKAMVRQAIAYNQAKAAPARKKAAPARKKIVRTKAAKNKAAQKKA